MNPKISGLIKQYQMEKNQEAIITLWEDFRPLIISLMRRFYIPMGNQEDVLQDTFVQLLECAASYDPSQQMPFEGYYKLHLQYWFLNQMRKKSDILCVDHDWSNGVSMTDFVETTMGNAPELLMANETLGEVRKALETLTDKQRQAVVLFYLHGLPLAKVAEEIGCSYNGAHRHKAAGIRNIKSMMA